MKTSQVKKVLIRLWKEAPMDDSETRVALEEAVKAIDKLNPRKIIHETYRVYDDNGFVSKEMEVDECPSCGDEDTIWSRIGDGNNYCGECGQLLNWSHDE